MRIVLVIIYVILLFVSALCYQWKKASKLEETDTHRRFNLSGVVPFVPNSILLAACVYFGAFYFCIFIGGFWEQIDETPLIYATSEFSFLRIGMMGLMSIVSGLMLRYFYDVLTEAYTKRSMQIIHICAFILIGILGLISKNVYMNSPRAAEDNWNLLGCIFAFGGWFTEFFIIYARRETMQHRLIARCMQEVVDEKYNNYLKLENLAHKTDEWEHEVSEQLLKLQNLGKDELTPIIAYCSDVLDHRVQTEQVAYTGRDVLDRVLGDCIKEARENGTLPHFNRADLKDCRIPEYVLVSLFSELMQILTKQHTTGSPMQVDINTVWLNEELNITCEGYANIRSLKKELQRNRILYTILAEYKGYIKTTAVKKTMKYKISITLMEV